MSDAVESPARVALITHPVEGADTFARRLVARRIAACVNLVGVRSVYRWEGEVHDEPEMLLVAKTTADREDELARVLAEEHPYAVPELVLLDPVHVEERYLTWLRGETGGERRGGE